MRAGLILFVLCLPLAAQSFAQSAAPSGNAAGARVEGRVTSVAGDPLRKANLRLQNTQAPGPSNAQPPPPNYTSSSDADGNFLFEDVDPGRYILSAERNGYLAAHYGTGRRSQVFNVAVGQRVTGLIIKMTPQAVVGGKVTDEDGDPL